MTDLKSLIRLQAWLSPAFPTGAFSYSSGLEAAIDQRFVEDQQSVSVWLSDVLESGPGWNDAVLLAQSWRCFDQKTEIEELIALAHALSFSKERYLETTAQGGAFLKACKAWQRTGLAADDCPLPIAVGVLAAGMNVGLDETLVAYLHAYISNQVQAALRLMKLGQQGGLELLANLEDKVLEIAAKASQSTLDDLGGCTLLADIAAMKHETMQSRIFRS